MLREPSTTPPHEYSPRARRRADAQLYVPERVRHGARVPSGANRLRRPSRSTRLAIVGVVLIAGEILVVPEMARESARATVSSIGSSRAAAPGGGRGSVATRAAISADGSERARGGASGEAPAPGAATAAAPGGGAPARLATSPDPAATHVTTSAGAVATSPATAVAGGGLSDAAERAVVALLARLTEARALATRTGQTVTVVLDPATGRLWRMAGDDPDAALSSVGAIPLGGTVTLGSLTARPSFTFSLDDIEADSVWVRDGVTRVAVVLDPRSGQPRANR